MESMYSALYVSTPDSKDSLCLSGASCLSICLSFRLKSLQALGEVGAPPRARPVTCLRKAQHVRQGGLRAVTSTFVLATSSMTLLKVKTLADLQVCCWVSAHVSFCKHVTLV